MRNHIFSGDLGISIFIKNRKNISIFLLKKGYLFRAMNLEPNSSFGCGIIKIYYESELKKKSLFRESPFGLPSDDKIVIIRD